MSEEERQKLKSLAKEIEEGKRTLFNFNRMFIAFYRKFNKTTQTRFCAKGSSDRVEHLVERMGEWEKELSLLAKD